MFECEILESAVVYRLVGTVMELETAMLETVLLFLTRQQGPLPV